MTLVLLCGAALLAGPLTVPAVSAEMRTTSVTLVNDSDNRMHLLGNGEDYLWRPGAGNVEVSGSPADGEIVVHVSGGPSRTDLEFVLAAPHGRPLQRGTYQDDQPGPRRTAESARIDLAGDYEECTEARGRFEVREVAPDLSRLWITYQHDCNMATVFGEIRYGMPAPDGPLTAPASVDWPTEYAEDRGAPVPVHVINTTDSAFVVDNIDVTAGSDTFSLVSETCGTLLPGRECRAYVGFRPRHGTALQGVLTVETSVGTSTVQLTGGRHPGVTRALLYSQPGDPVGSGSDFAFEPGSSYLSADGTPREISIGANGGRDSFSMLLAAPEGEVLVPGRTYTGATDVPRLGEATLDVVVDFACGNPRGNFTVTELAFEDGRLTKAAVTFEQWCGGALSGLFGTVAYRADALPEPQWDRQPPGPVHDLGISGQLGSALLTWRNPRSTAWAGTTVQQRVGQYGTGRPLGIGIYRGRGTTAFATALSQGVDYTFSVTPYDFDRRLGKTTRMVLLGTDLRVRAPAVVRRPQDVPVRGRLVEATSGAPVARAELRVMSRSGKTGPWRFVRSAKTNPKGRFRLKEFTLASRTDQLRIAFPGRGRLSGSSVGPVTLRLRR
jgi:hypothetical protein